MSEIFDEGSLLQLANRIDLEAKKLVDRHAGELIGEEEDYTQLVVSMLKCVINDYVLQLRPSSAYRLGGTSSGEVRLNAAEFDGRPASRKGVGSEESLTGADLILVFKSEGVEGLESQKGLLAQAKKRDTRFRSTTDNGLFDQCRKMARITDHSYAFIYGLNGIHVFKDVPDKKILKASESDFTLGQLVANFVSCRVGDTALHELRKSKFIGVATELRRNRMLQAATKAEADILQITAELD